jgi:tRNA modification GTPase
VNKSVASATDRATIFALASAPGPAGIAVWRLSGPRARDAFAALCGGALPEPKVMTRVRVRDPATGAVFDDGLAAWFPGPASFTGEDVLELYVHGGRAISRAMAAALGTVAGVRMATAGEFTRRAVEAGKLDLTQAEAIADLVAAETEAQHLQARRQLDGALGALYDGWKRGILAILARYEAGMDFPDEDIPAEIFAKARPAIESLIAAMSAHLADARRGERIRDGIRVAITGAPNVGKSSLLNALAQRDVAIVSNRPGTTRDVLEVALDLGGLPVLVADTAGLRESADEIEAEGVRRAQAWAASADVVVRVVDAQGWSGQGPVRENPEVSGVPRAVMAVNKIDAAPAARAVPITGHASEVVFVSARTGEGLPELLDVLRAACGDLLGQTEAAAITRARHRRGVVAARDALERAIHQPEVELAGEELRQALRALGGITGELGVEAVLDVIFREFCIGK